MKDLRNHRRYLWIFGMVVIGRETKMFFLKPEFECREECDKEEGLS